MTKEQQDDSDTIFLQITSGDFKDIEEAKQAVALFYVPDMTISRVGICHAISRLERHFKNL